MKLKEASRRIAQLLGLTNIPGFSFKCPSLRFGASEEKDINICLSSSAGGVSGGVGGGGACYELVVLANDI